MPDVVDNSQCKESEYYGKSDAYSYYDDLHGEVSLSSDYLCLCTVLLSLELACGKAEGRLDHTERFHDADNSCSSDAADSDVSCVFLEDLLR